MQLTEPTAIQRKIMEVMAQKHITFQDLTTLLHRDRSTISRIVRMPTEKLIALETIMNELGLIIVENNKN